ncbi:class I SAM-dependent methyltransferase [Bradyrhizobium sp. Tv2a-2]|uniref:class I SAM-dependent methyltransferase n=1 Tax=Bradyrhizobium sp. Tv2a-2 TaxID=113395 RepID=UPI000464C47B|nr:class I SAM-dependent methyltransferase [Bradyrhizobium sp. Tv2a-2]
MSELNAKLRSLPARIFKNMNRKMPASPVKSAPRDPREWIKLAREKFDLLPMRTQELMDRHELVPDANAVVFFKDDIEREAGVTLERLAANPEPAAIAQAIDEIIRWLTVSQCAHAHREGLYFAHAEPHMAQQWERIIWPIIKEEDFTSTLELACGHGRNTEFLRRFAKSIDVIDVNQVCVDACRERFGSQRDGCSFRYRVTSGNQLPVESSSISFGYSWDSMVHFDKLVVRDYVFEFARALKPGGSAFLHHSNYGTIAPNSSWTKNHGNRSDMTAELMREYVKEAGLAIKFQRLSGRADGWGIDDLDCLTLLFKPVAS